jgi:hypothetical protein
MSSPTIAALSRRPKYISDSEGIGGGMGVGRDWEEPNNEPQISSAGGEAELIAELLRMLDQRQREGSANALERIPTGPIGGAVAAVSPDTYANMANTNLGGEIGNAGNAPDAMMLALGGGLEQAGLRRQSASSGSDVLVRQLMKGVQPASKNSLVSPEATPQWLASAASARRPPVEPSPELVSALADADAAVSGQRLPKSVSSAVSNLPPVAEGFTRVWRVEGPSAVEAGGAGGKSGGNWFETNLGAYATENTSPENVKYVDIPTARFSQLQSDPNATEVRLPEGYIAQSRFLGRRR